MLQPSQGSVGEILRLATRLGFTAFGGPAAHIAMLHDEVVTRRGWVDEQHFLDMVGATNLVPGPNSTEMVIHVGYHRARWKGLIAAGVGFILPAALIVGILAWAYVTYGSTPQGASLLYGIKPVVIAIVLQALYKLGKTAVKGPLLAAAGIAVFVLYLFGVNELLLLFCIGLLVALVQFARRDGGFSVKGLLPVDRSGRLAPDRIPVGPREPGSIVSGLSESGRAALRQRLRAARFSAQRSGAASGLTD